MSDFEISGSIKDIKNKPLSDLHIQAWDSDQGLLEERNDDLLDSTWTKNDGSFKINFGKKQFEEAINFLQEGNPDIYLIIRNKLGEIIHKTDVRRGIKPSMKNHLVFNIKLNLDDLETKVKPKDDPFSENMNIRIAAFQSFGQRSDFMENLQQNFTQLLSTLSAWASYNNSLSWRAIGYDGPIVKRYPWRKADHSHKVPWKK